MKTNWLKRFIRDSRRMRMSAHEKRTMISSILGVSSIPSPYSFVFTFMEYRHRIVVAAIIVAFVITSGGTSIVAASALPGEMLYSFKVNINEEIQSLVAGTPDAKIKFAVKRTEKRLEEAEELSKSGKLNAQTQAIIEDNIERHSKSIKENIVALTSENATATVKSVIDNLSNTIEEHEAVLTVIASSTTSSTSTNKSIDALIVKVNDVKVELQDISDDVANDANTELKIPDIVGTSTPPLTDVIPAEPIDTGTSTATTTDSSATTTEPIKPSDIL